MTEQEVVAHMEGCQTRDEWNQACDHVKDSFGGQYPDFWYQAIILSGLGDRVMARWGGDTKIRWEVHGPDGVVERGEFGHEPQ